MKTPSTSRKKTTLSPRPVGIADWLVLLVLWAAHCRLVGWGGGSGGGARCLSKFNAVQRAWWIWGGG